MKSLKIESENCLLSVSGYGDGLNINDNNLIEIIRTNLPVGLVGYHNYPVKLNISIEFLDADLNVQTDGYTVEKEEDKQDEDASTEGDADA